jgi:hypothetical protein
MRKSSDIVRSDERSGECNLGSPLREIRTAGSERGDGFQEFNLKARPYPPLALSRYAPSASLSIGQYVVDQWIRTITFLISSKSNPIFCFPLPQRAV